MLFTPFKQVFQFIGVSNFRMSALFLKNILGYNTPVTLSILDQRDYN